METRLPPTTPLTVVVCGPSGVGKSTIGRLLADALGLVFFEGDAYHSAANVEKMRAGHPLTDENRAPWLQRLRTEVIEDNVVCKGFGIVLACSALKRMYRDILRGRPECSDETPLVVFAMLTGKEDIIGARMSARQGHFMPSSLLTSQLAALEPLGPSCEEGITVDISKSPDVLVAEILTWLQCATAA